MESQDVVTAIHQLEMNLTHKIHEQTTALKINNERIRNLTKTVEEHDESLYGCDQKAFPGVIADLERVKNSDKERKWTVRTVVTGFVAVLAKVIWDAFSV